MSGIDDLAEKLKKKTEIKKIEKSTLQKVNTSEEKPLKHTIYLSPSLSRKLSEFLAKRILKGVKENKYDVICKAIAEYIDRNEP